MRKIAANIIFPVDAKPIKNGYLVIDNDESVVELVDTGGIIKEIAGLEYYSGVLIPGFVFGHEKIAPVQLSQMLTDSAEEKKAVRFLYASGIQAIGSISDLQMANGNFSMLSVLREYQKSNSEGDFVKALKFFTLQKAHDFNLDHACGSFTKNKKSGVLLLTGFNYNTFNVSEKSTITRLV